MNCNSDFEFEYIGQFGLIEKVALLSLNDDNCLIKLKDNKLIRTSKDEVKIVSKPHSQIKTIDEINFEESFILVTELFMCYVKIVKVFSDDYGLKCDNINEILVEVVSYDNSLLFHEKETICAPLSDIYHVGEFISIRDLRETELPIPFEYSRYFLNPTVYQPLQEHIPNSILTWDAENSKLKLLHQIDETDDEFKETFETLGSVFIKQLSLIHNYSKHSNLGGSSTSKRLIDNLNRYLYWEYQYTSEDEANYAIGPNGICITSVRSMSGIIAVVLNKHNRLRIIAENKTVIQNARSLLEIEKCDYYFENSLVPLLIGKLANHIKELITKTGLHCVYIPNLCFDGKLNDVVQVAALFNKHTATNRSRTNSVNSSGNESINVTSEQHNSNDDTLNGDTDSCDKIKPVRRRRITLYGRKEAITSSKMLLEIEEDVKELKLELEMKRSMKPNAGTVSNSILMSSNMSSVSSLSRADLFKDSVPNSIPGSNVTSINNTGDKLDKIIDDSTKTSNPPADYQFENLQPPSPISWADIPIEEEVAPEAQVTSKTISSQHTINDDKQHHPSHPGNFLDFFSSVRQHPPRQSNDPLTMNGGGGGGGQMNGFSGQHQKPRHRNRQKRPHNKQPQNIDNSYNAELPNQYKQKSNTNNVNKNRQNSFKNFENSYHNRNANNNNMNVNKGQSNRNNRNKSKFYNNNNPNKLNDNNNNNQAYSSEYPDNY